MKYLLAALLLCVHALASASPVDPRLISDYYTAADEGTPAQVESMLERIGRENIDILPEGTVGTALYTSIMNNPDSAVSLLLLREGASPTKAINEQYTPLNEAAAKGKIEVIRELVRRGVIEATKDHGALALEYSSTPEVTNFFLQLGIIAQVGGSVYQRNIEALRPRPAAEMAAFLKMFGPEQVNAVDDKRKITLIRDAAEHGTPTEMEWLLEKFGRGYVNAEIANDDNTALTLAIAKNPNPAVAILLLQHGASTAGKDAVTVDYQPLPMAVKKGDIALVRELARYSAIEKSEDRGAFALSYARTVEMARLLLQLGVDPRKKEKVFDSKGAQVGMPPLFAYFRSSYPRNEEDTTPIMQALIEAGADVRELDPATGQTILHRSVQERDIEIAALLLDHGADVNARDPGGATPLVTAVVNVWSYQPDQPQIEEMVSLLLKHGADPNLASEENINMSVLPIVEVRNNPALTRMLLEAGADPKKRNWEGMTALDKTRNKKVIALLINAGGGTEEQVRLYRLGLPPNLLTDARRIGKALIPFSGVLILFVAPILFLMVYVFSPGMRSDINYQGLAAGARFELLAVFGFNLAILLAMSAVFFYYAPSFYYRWLAPITVLNWMVAALAFERGRSRHLKAAQNGAAQ